MNILVITEQREGQWNPVSLETVAAAQQIAAQVAGARVAGQVAGEVAGQTKTLLSALVVGKGVRKLADELAALKLEQVLLAEHDLLERYTPDGFTLAIRQVIEQFKPDLVLFPHTYQVRDFAPQLAASIGRGDGQGHGHAMIGDCIAYRYENGQLIFVRQMFQGKMAADVTFCGPAPWFASFQAGAFRGDQVEKGAATAPVQSVEITLEPAQIRTTPLELFREAKQAVDLAQAPILVAIGRGIKAPENIPMAEKLAKLLGGELAASRPICDEGWLPMDRQVGSSGQTVAPKLYLALGISGAIQHVVGMKGARTVAAINKDPNAPIFEVADYGIVGDIFELIPALTEALEKK
jgi:electron transfer flavoprotein alpha subunit